MKNMFLFLSLLVSVASFASERDQLSCSDKCKATIFDANVELEYHSGYSSSSVGIMVTEVCENITFDNCSIGNRKEEGTIIYHIWAACIVESAKEYCEEQYRKNRQ